MPVEEGKAAPKFTLVDQDGNKQALKEQAGKKVVIFFYPKDDTPGCTKESCAFQDLSGEFDALNTVVWGISPDDEASHVRFRDKYGLSFPLLCDPNKKVMEKYGAYGEKMMYGKKVVGVIRSTVIVDEKGKVLKHYKRVQRAGDHPAKVLEFLQG